jgi:alkylation response protein AidB-like acyl-CoA dehydrogenase
VTSTESRLPVAPASVTGILDAVRNLSGSLAAGVAQNEAARRLPRESVTAVRTTGLPTLRVPARYGGPGGSLRDLFGAVITIAAADPNLAQGLRSHFGFIEGLLSRVSPDAETARERWLAEVLSGKLFGLASAELGVVSPAEFATAVRPGENGGLVLDGRKYYSTGSLFADSVEVVAVDATGRLVSLVVPVDREGVTLIDDFDAMGQRTTASGTTTFGGVRVEPDEILEVLDWTDTDRPLTYLGGYYQLYLAAVAAR